MTSSESPEPTDETSVETPIETPAESSETTETTSVETTTTTTTTPEFTIVTTTKSIEGVVFDKTTETSINIPIAIATPQSKLERFKSELDNLEKSYNDLISENASLKVDLKTALDSTFNSASILEENANLKSELAGYKAVEKLTPFIKANNCCTKQFYDQVEETPLASVKKLTEVDPSSSKSILTQSLVSYVTTSGTISLDVVKKIVLLGADIHANSEKAFRCAVENNQFVVAKYLISCGADINTVGSYTIKNTTKSEQLFFLVANGSNIPSDCSARVYLTIDYIVRCNESVFSKIEVCKKLGYTTKPEYPSIVNEITDDQLKIMTGPEIASMITMHSSHDTPNKVLLKRLADAFTEKYEI